MARVTRAVTGAAAATEFLEPLGLPRRLAEAGRGAGAALGLIRRSMGPQNFLLSFLRLRDKDPLLRSEAIAQRFGNKWKRFFCVQ